MNGTSRNGRGDSSPLRVLWRKRAALAVFGILGLIAGAAYLLVAQRVYSVSAKVFVSRPVLTDAGDTSIAGTVKSGELFHATQAQLLKSTPVLAMAIVKPGTDEMQTFADVGNRSAWLKQHLDVEAGKNDELITITLDTPHPKEGERIIEAVIDSYSAFQKDEKKLQADEVINALKEEKGKIDTQIAETIARLTEAKARSGSSAVVGDEEEPANRRLDTLQEALAKAELESIDRKAQYTAALAAVNVDDPSKLDMALPPGPVTEAEIEMMRQEAASLQRRLAADSRKYLPTHPMMKQNSEKIADLNLQYVAALRTRLAQAQQRESDVRRSVNEEVQRATAYRQQAEVVRNLVRDQDRLTATAEALDRRIKDASLKIDTGLISVQTTEPPGSLESTYRPSAAAVLPAGALLGLALGSIVLLIRESANPRLATPEGVRAALGLPVLGSIPTSAARTIESFGWSVHADATGEAAEAFRAVRTSLQFGLSATGGGRRVVISSPEQMDGKSTLASNLAIALAKSGKNVLLVDANLRDPSQHRIFGVSDSVGLVDVLASGELNERAIRRTTIERLHVMPAGAVPKNPSELLNSSALSDALEQLGAKYDLVLVDTPAVGVVDDARIVAAGCEGAILVVRAGRSNRRLASAARDGLLSVGCPVVGVVVNGCRTSGAGAYGGAGPGPGFPVAGRKGGADSQITSPPDVESDAASSMQQADRSI